MSVTLDSSFLADAAYSSAISPAGPFLCTSVLIRVNQSITERNQEMSTYTRVTHERVDRSIVDDARAPGHDGDQVLGEEEERVLIRVSLHFGRHQTLFAVYYTRPGDLDVRC